AGRGDADAGGSLGAVDEDVPAELVAGAVAARRLDRRPGGSMTRPSGRSTSGSGRAPDRGRLAALAGTAESSRSRKMGRGLLRGLIRRRRTDLRLVGVGLVRDGRARGSPTRSCREPRIQTPPRLEAPCARGPYAARSCAGASLKGG